MIRQLLSCENLSRKNLSCEPWPCELLPRHFAQPSDLPLAVAVNEVV